MKLLQEKNQLEMLETMELLQEKSQFEVLERIQVLQEKSLQEVLETMELLQEKSWVKEIQTMELWQEKSLVQTKSSLCIYSLQGWRVFCMLSHTKTTLFSTMSWCFLNFNLILCVGYKY